MNAFYGVLCCRFNRTKFFPRLTSLRLVTNMTESLKPPEDVRGMTVLDRDRFQTVARVPCYKTTTDKISSVLKILKPCMLKMPKLQPVCQEENGGKRILLHPLKYREALSERTDLTEVTWTDVELKYENWSSDDIFRAVLPEDSAGNVSSFSIVGHIIHLNLKAELLDYKFLIGQVLLDKYGSNIRTVVNKSEMIDNTFRNFRMEHLAGEQNYRVVVKENNCQYAFDYEKVFWNPRLCGEHDRLAKKIDSKDLVCDVFAGVGPFAVPLAKKGCEVHANDLNPDSHHWLCHNAKLNKVDIRTYNMDGKDFIQTVVKRKIVEHCNDERDNVGNLHILMNLPALAPTFLELFNGLLTGESVKFSERELIVHCYYFRRKDEDDLKVIGQYLSKNILEGAEIFLVRVVAPNKYMMRITYKLPEDVLFFKNDNCEKPLAKRIKLSTEECNGLLQNLGTSS